jgi:hypothetical protein
VGQKGRDDGQNPHGHQARHDGQGLGRHQHGLDHDAGQGQDGESRRHPAGRKVVSFHGHADAWMGKTREFIVSNGNYTDRADPRPASYRFSLMICRTREREARLDSGGD